MEIPSKKTRKKFQTKKKMMTRTDFNNVESEISLVVNDMQKRYPDCHYTIRILLWDDGTSSIECRHAHKEGDDMIISTSTYYQNELEFKEYLLDFQSVKIDGRGNEYNIKKKRHETKRILRNHGTLC